MASTTCVAQDTIKVSVEEVRIPIIAKDSGGRFDPTVELNDLLVRDNGMAQPLKSVYRMPASVLLLLDTGEELNRAKNVRLTREAAAALIADLQPDDRIAVMQVNNRVELLQPWTTTQADAIKSLNQLLPAKRSALEAGLLAAVAQFGRRGIKGALAERSEEFSVLTEETGGNLWLPGTAEEMIRRAHEVARDIDAQYVMSYRPRPPLASSGPTEYRRIEVLSRRGYVVRPDLLLN